MDNSSMKDLISIAEGSLITRDEAKNRVKTAVLKTDLNFKDVLHDMESQGTFTDKHVSVDDMKRSYQKAVTKSGGKSKKINTKDSSGKQVIVSLADQVNRAGINAEVIAAMDELGIGKTRGGKVKSALSSVANAAYGSMFGESIVNEAEVSDELVRKFFEKLINALEEVDESYTDGANEIEDS